MKASAEVSATRHTPGPWGAGRADRANFVAVVSAKGRGDIALLYRSSQTSTCKGIDADEAWANARLIAAAPELLELAKGYEQWEADLILCSEAWDRSPGKDLPEITTELWEKLLALQTKRNQIIAKAEGRSQ